MFKMTADSRLKLAFMWLVSLAILLVIWPVYRSVLNVEIDTNEGWNAFYADAAMGRMPLYPDSDQLITNNYPPLSFYVVGYLGRAIGDVIFAGRLISLVSVLAIGFAVGICVRQFNGTPAAAWLAGLYFVATMCGFFTDYVGMNDPQLFAQAIMTAGFALFLAANRRGHGFVLPLLVMVVAGFFKHNIVSMPMTAMIWLVVKHPRQSLKPSAAAMGAIVAGFVICHLAYGPDFLLNMLAPRFYTWRHPVGAIGHLQWVIVGLMAWTYIGFQQRREGAVQLCNLLVGISFVMFFLQKAGDGVGHNAQFDLVIAVSIGVGLVFDALARPALAGTYAPAFLRATFVTMICCRLMMTSRFEPVRLLVDRTFHENLKVSQDVMAETVSRIQAFPNDAAGSNYACFRSGKPFTIDLFNTGQRVKLNRLPRDIIDNKVADGTLQIFWLESKKSSQPVVQAAFSELAPVE
ncbi:glycosyltransferase family protein [Schlesneria paludicola]|uniref:glycosyltransferase family 39 protein n=1 Tax=Schlesneria paludicola TaxID=360056 RepID=UPI00029A9FA9|nr:glycosyltransferase family 39 protein [Schlesneria paludicola]